jgi:DNA-binding NarL/FixJ family response regulator
VRLLGIAQVPKNILIADDSRVVREVLREFLEDRGNVKVCGEAANGFEAIQSAKKLRPDLVLLDLTMPQMNGAEAASVLKKLMPNVPIIVFTMFSENLGKSSLAAALGVDLVLSKPDGFRGLIEAIDAPPGDCLPHLADPSSSLSCG